MSCCGKKLKKAASIATGYSLMAVNKLLHLPGDKYAFADRRLDTCRGCEHHTWLTVADYKDWLTANGGLARFTTEIARLDQWPLLPQQDYAKGRKLFCRVCKCWLPAKAYVAGEQCPTGLWMDDKES